MLCEAFKDQILDCWHRHMFFNLLVCKVVELMTCCTSHDWNKSEETLEITCICKMSAQA